MEEDFDDDTMDACLIAAGQRAEHYEMAAYGTLVAWARAMGHEEVADLLQETLDEEKAADEKLSVSRKAASTKARPTPPAPTRMRKPQPSALPPRKKTATNGKTGARRRVATASWVLVRYSDSHAGDSGDEPRINRYRWAAFTRTRWRPSGHPPPSQQ